MLFEPATIILSAVLTIMLVGVTLSVLFKNSQRGNASAGWWVTAFILISIGFVCFSVSSTPQSVVRVMMNVSFLTGYACAFNGTRALAGRKRMLWPVALALLVWPTVVWTLKPDFDTRAMIFSIFVLGFTSACGWEFYHGAKPYERSRRIAAIACAIHAVFYCARTIFGPTLSMAEGGDANVIKIWGSLVALEALPFTAILAILVISISHEQNSYQQKTIAHTDYLTGIGNRRAFEQTLADLQKSNTSLLQRHLLLLDLDHFKQVNDQLGHAKGDQLLCQFVALIQKELPQPEQFWRIGGDEFAVLVDHHSDTSIAALVQSLRCTVENAPSLAEIRATIPLSVSIGVAALNGRDDVTPILRLADTALYEDKFSRRQAKPKSLVSSV